MKNLLLSLLCLFLYITGSAQEKPVYKINIDEIYTQLKNVDVDIISKKSKDQNITENIKLSLPDPSGKLIEFSPVKSTVLSKELEAKYPDIKTYRIIGKDGIDGALTTSPLGLHAYYFTSQGNVVISVSDPLKNEYSVKYEPFDFENMDNINHPESINNLIKTSDFELEEIDNSISEIDNPASNYNQLRTRALQASSNGKKLRKYKIAIITDESYYAHYGSTSAVTAAVTSIINSLSAFYEKSVSVAFELKAIKVFKNNNEGPLQNTGTSAGIAFYNLSVSNPSNFGFEKYDIGHVLRYTPGALSYSINNNSKACSEEIKTYSEGEAIIKGAAITGATTDRLSYLLKIIGVQLGAVHTTNSNNCYATLSTRMALEPGSGSTIMGSWGNCKQDNFPGWANPTYFHSYSLYNITEFVTNGLGNTCGTSSSTGNQHPVINLNPNENLMKIPKGTPFSLEGSGTHPLSHSLYYYWEQYDPANLRGTAEDLQFHNYGPVFKSVAPSPTGQKRTFPELSTILKGNKPNVTEALPQVPRNLTFAFTATDLKSGGGAFTYDLLTVQVVDAGPFLITSQNTPTYWIYNGSNMATVNWSVNDTDLPPLNVEMVKISLSTDGGLTFPIILGDNLPNNGSYSFTIPNEITNKGRIKIEPIGDYIFFDINDVDIKISSSCSTISTTFADDSPISAQKSSQDLDLKLISKGPIINKFTGQLSTMSKEGRLTMIKDTTYCHFQNSNEMHYNIHRFIVGSKGVYTFEGSESIFTFGTVISLGRKGYEPKDYCNNILWTTAHNYFGSNYIYNSITINLDPGEYTLIVSSYSRFSDYPPLPSDYEVLVSGGDIYELPPETNSPYAYTYVVKNNSNDKIVGFRNDSNLQNDLIYPKGEYTVYGMAYVGGTNLDTYIDKGFSTLQSALNSQTVCGKLSNNSKVIDVTNCTPKINLSGNDIPDDALAEYTIESTQIIESGNNVLYRAGKSITLTPEEGKGFIVDSGAVFTAEISECE